MQLNFAILKNFQLLTGIRTLNLILIWEVIPSLLYRWLEEMDFQN